MYSDVSDLIRKVGCSSYPSETYFSSVVSRYKMYRKTKIVKQRLLAFGGIIATIIVAYFGYVSITKDISTLETSFGEENVQSHTTR